MVLDLQSNVVFLDRNLTLDIINVLSADAKIKVFTINLRKHDQRIFEIISTNNFLWNVDMGMTDTILSVNDALAWLNGFAGYGFQKPYLEIWFKHFYTNLQKELTNPDGSINTLDIIVFEFPEFGLRSEQIQANIFAILNTIVRMCRGSIDYQVPGHEKLFNDCLFLIDDDWVNFGPSCKNQDFDLF